MSRDFKSNITRIWRDLVSGSMAGFAVVLTGHPFDSLKV